jgi:hypothetical protein
MPPERAQVRIDNLFPGRLAGKTGEILVIFGCHAGFYGSVKFL